ncbi:MULTISPECIES: acyl-CoA thioesterase II [unclassified Mycolicibacterium]|uniref:acyl-CoA thioesterase n=1 Tax=unclassified Mycolicibacterium TaxID=2636767 RepID=UPI00130A5981|nr:MULTISPECIES: thioesterase family protein [unclassified Mycolicibacterium]MUL82148.1 thioesterase family protein [Mycolicibacterium sp. CBMA 329]MUL87914.1 thioesterase family protein [Mycolicibacterium sp. CBMA 331]MUM02245.1 thioesterase family protein [Mycolicibacterium sp. CBMA 334]MUM26470.1 thioesterase family protein [Mycolicibacterium sp. CBMA 295]MUM38211.1 thioesterase family protein [Mycolicibacterium sp. CBMA 247]
MHPLDKALELEPSGDGRWRGRTVPEWANMVGPFGGVTAATLVRAVELHPQRHGQPIALTVNYLAPIADGEFEIETRIVKTNRSNQHWIVELSQDGDVKTTATAVFGLRRQGWSDTEVAPPQAPAPEDIVPSVPPFGVVWFDNFDTRFVDGAMPDPGNDPVEPPESPNSTTTLWVRNNPPRPMDFAALTAVSDIFYPRVFLRRGQFVPAGTVSISVYFHADDEQLAAQGDDFVLGTARAHRYSGGYFDQSAHIFGRTGALLVTTHQFVYFKG